MRVLATRQRIEQHVAALALGEAVEHAGDALVLGVGPFADQQVGMKRFVVRVGRCRARLAVDEVAVEVDVVFGRPREVRETVGIERVHQHHADAGGQPCRAARVQPADLDGRAGESFLAVRATEEQRLSRRFRSPKQATSIASGPPSGAFFAGCRNDRTSPCAAVAALRNFARALA
jgi:hypothetical protein